MAAQRPLEVAADELTALIDENDLEAGFANIELDVPGHKLLFRWKAGAPIPAAVSMLIAEIESKTGANVGIKSVPHSMDELQVEFKRIFEEAKNIPELVIAGIGPLSGYDGLRVEVEGSVAQASKHSIFKIGSNNKIRKDLYSGQRRTTLSRWYDVQPWWGGAAIRSGFSGCSSGFAVGNLRGRYILTAGHCASHQNGVQFTNGGNLVMGTSQGSDDSTDLLDSILIKVGQVQNARRPPTACP